MDDYSYAIKCQMEGYQLYVTDTVEYNKLLSSMVKTNCHFFISTAGLIPSK